MIIRTGPTSITDTATPPSAAVRRTWSRRPELEEGEETVLTIAAGELDEEQTAAWLRGYLVAPDFV